jgi:hypothetical protein
MVKVARKKVISDKYFHTEGVPWFRTYFLSISFFFFYLFDEFLDVGFFNRCGFF